MDFAQRIPRKGGHQRGNNSSARRSQNGNVILDPPSARMHHRHNSTNNHINEINNPADGSDSSNFSEGAPERRQQKPDKEEKVKRKRDATKKQLQASQKQLQASQQEWDRKRQNKGYSLEQAYGEAYKEGVTFDGVSLKKKSRAKSHHQSAFAGLEGSGSKRGRGESDKSPFRTSQYSDPLDEANEEQWRNKSSRGSSRADITNRMGRNMDNLTQGNKYGAGSTTTNRQKKKSKARNRDDVIDVDCDEERSDGSGKKRRTSPYFGDSNQSIESPSSSSVNQDRGDEYYVDGGWGSSGSGGHKEDSMTEVEAALDLANSSTYFTGTGDFGLKRDPNKKKTGKQKKVAKSVRKPSTYPTTPRFLKKEQKDELEEYPSDNEAEFGESARQEKNSSALWHNTNQDRTRRSKQKVYGQARKEQSNATRKKMTRMGMTEDPDYRDDEWKMADDKSSLGSTNDSRRQTRSRSKSRKAKKKNEVIEILDSSSEEESSDDEAISLGGMESNRTAEIQSTPKRERSVGDLFSIDAARIAVGKKVFKSKCELKFQFGTKKQYMLFSWNNAEGKRKTHRVSLKEDSEELRGLNYYVSEESENNGGIVDGVDDSMTIIAFKIVPTKENEFTMYSKSFKEDSYVTVEVRDTDQFVAMLEQMKENQALKTFFNSRPEIEFYDLKEYTSALIKDTENENNRRRSTRLSQAKAKKDRSVLEKPLLVFPFEAVEEEFLAATSELNELKIAREPVIAASDEASDQPQDSNPNEPQAENENVKGSSRTHYITIREEDIERLAPGEFLNDALVDFWMKWISGAPNKPDPDVHVFTSHFMSTLASEGPKAVSSWTAKKNIDIFEKKLIFVPVNSDLHWSLCVVVNPGFIANNLDEENANSRSIEGSFLLFLDSLTMHRKKKVARNIYEWLNFEWERLKKKVEGVPKQPFKFGNMPLLAPPKIPYQSNGCDCGVFVCRYAYSLFQMRHQCFSQFDMADDCRDLFLYKDLFDFDMKDIARIRVEIERLIRNLSKVYLRLKKEEKVKRKNKSSSSENDNSSSAVASAEETTDEQNKSEGVDESFDSSGDDVGVSGEGQSDETPVEGSLVASTEKENVENSSDTSKKDDEVKSNEEQDDDISVSEKESQDLLQSYDSESC